MRSSTQEHIEGPAATDWVGRMIRLAAVAMITATSAWAQSSKPNPAGPTQCIAIVNPALEGMPGNASEASAGLRDLIASYLTGPSVKVVALDAKLPSLAAEEAKQKSCESLLFVTFRRKSNNHGFLKALGQAAGTSSWRLPSGGSAASATARAGAAGGLQAASSLAQSTKARDEVSLEYRLQSADGRVQFGPRTERRTAKTDGEDLLTPLVEHAAEAIVSGESAK
jgi:hypothetical protein